MTLALVIQLFLLFNRHQIFIPPYLCVGLKCCLYAFFVGWLSPKITRCCELFLLCLKQCFLCCTCLQHNAFQMIRSFTFFFCPLSYIFRSDSCAFLLVCGCSIFPIFFRYRATQNISNGQGTPGLCPTSMDTFDACSFSKECELN